MCPVLTLENVAGRQGLEPRYADPESAVLPLDDLPGALILTLAYGAAPKYEVKGMVAEPGLSLSGADAHGVLSRARPAQVLEQEDHFVLLVLQGAHAMRFGHHGAAPAVIELLDRLRQLGTAAPAPPAAFKNAGA